MDHISKKCQTYKKNLKEEIEELIDLEPFNIIRIKLIIERATDEINLIMKQEMKNFDDIETKTMMEVREITIRKTKENLDEFKIHESEIKLNADIKILKEKENKIRNIIDYLKKLKVRLLGFYGEKYRFITFHK